MGFISDWYKKGKIKNQEACVHVWRRAGYAWQGYEPKYCVKCGLEQLQPNPRRRL